MAGASPKSEPPFISFLEEVAPEYLPVIGVLSVELVNLEQAFAHFLACILRVPLDVGEAMFFAPLVTGVRLSIVQKAADKCLARYPLHSKKAKASLKKARTQFNKRNEFLHQPWGLLSDGKVATSPLPISKAALRHVPLAEIEEAVYRVRCLMADMRDLIYAIATDPTYSPWPDTPPEPVPGANNDRQEAPRPGPLGQPRSSRG
jgi:hypothetical protein